MQSFKDSNGREWTISINALNLRNASQKHGFKIVRGADNPLDAKTVELIKNDDIFLDVIYSFLVNSPPMEEFLAAIDGPTGDRMGEAFWLELINFSRPQAEGLAKITVEKTRKVIAMEVAKATAMMEEMTTESLLQMMKSSGNSSTSLSGTQEAEQAT